MSDLDRREGESELQYHRRLIFGKLKNKTLSDVDYSELAEHLYGRSYAPDVARRMAYGECRILELLDAEQAFNETKPDSRIQNDLMELQMERKRLSDQRRELTKIISEAGRFEHIVDRLTAAAEDLNERHPLNTLMFEHDGKSGGCEAVLCLNDWHYGMVTNNIYNAYNTSICRDRVLSVTREAIERILLHKPDVLHIVLLGDSYHGAIHNTCRVASEELVADQLMQVAEMIAQTISTLSAYVGAVEVYSTYGNHGRTVQRKEDNMHRDNMERIIPWWLKQRLRDAANVHINEPREDEFIQFDIFDYGIVCVHGDLDDVRNNTRIIPLLFNRTCGKYIDCVIMGDRHHAEEFNEFGISSYIADALCGTDDYANEKRKYSSYGQLMQFWKPGYGIDAVYRLR